VQERVLVDDYDAPRTADADQPGEPALQALVGSQPGRATDPVGDVDPVEAEVALAAVDPTDEEFAVPLVPRQLDEFICTSCYLVHQNSCLVDLQRRICTDCAS